MCGKFTQMASWREVQAFSQPLVADPNEPTVTATPMRFAQVLRLNRDGARELVPMRWGFAEKNAAAPTRPKYMHARCETIDTRPTFAAAFREARGIAFVASFNEGEALANGKTKQWVIAPRDGGALALAVIFEEWRNGDERLDTFVLVTTPPNDLTARITDRMPAILPPEAWPAWLGESGAALSEIKALLKTHDDAGGWSMREQAPPQRRPR